MNPERVEISSGLSAKTFARFAEVISRELGIKMPDSKLHLVQGRLLSRVRELGLASLDEYCEYLFHSPSGEAERVHFVNAVTTNKTDFFREPAHFDYLARTALPSLGHGGGRSAPNRIKVWSAGCSSGEEPYTLAMVLSEYTRQERGLDFAVLATDVSTKVLDRARTGVYQESQVAPVPPHLRHKYLLRSRNADQELVRMVPKLRRKVSFHRLNFMDESYRVAEKFDAIFFRNVMIYFERPTQEAVLRKLCGNLVPGGYLFVGHSDATVGLDVPMTLVAPSILRREA
jgi:chemotaxis protein methyltransferase CheR